MTDVKSVNSEKTKMSKSAALLLALCWLSYACSYIGKLGYNANIVSIEKFFNITHASAGTVSTFFFFAYGAGQIINGIFCKKYNVKYCVIAVLLISAVCNFTLGLSDNFTLIKIVWFINGAALSVLWPSLIRLLSEVLPVKYSPKVVLVMGTTVATGTFIVYGLSALFVAAGNYRIIFYLAALLLPAVSFLWFFSYKKLVNSCLNEKNECESLQNVQDETNSESKSKLTKTLVFSIAALGFFAIITNLVKDGLTTWVPVILKEKYLVSDSIGIIMTLVMPMLAIFGASLAVVLNKKITDFVTLCGVMFLVVALLTFVLTLAGAGTFGMVITLVSLAGVSLLMSATNSTITSMAPLYLKKQVNAGMFAGIMDGLCYVGSTLSAYGLGAFADNSGWNAVFILLASLSAACVILSLIYIIVKRAESRKA